VVFRRWRACKLDVVTEPLCTPIAMPMTSRDLSSRYSNVLSAASAMLGGLSEDTAAMPRTDRWRSYQCAHDWCYHNIFYCYAWSHLSIVLMVLTASQTR
jgi:hypothetical protein